MTKRTVKLTKCPMCKSSKIKYIVEDRIYKHKHGVTKIPNVPRQKCFSCGEQFFGPESYDVINAFSGKKKSAVNE